MFMPFEFTAGTRDGGSNLTIRGTAGTAQAFRGAEQVQALSFSEDATVSDAGDAAIRAIGGAGDGWGHARRDREREDAAVALAAGQRDGATHQRDQAAGDRQHGADPRAHGKGDSGILAVDP